MGVIRQEPTPPFDDLDDRVHHNGNEEKHFVGGILTHKSTKLFDALINPTCFTPDLAKNPGLVWRNCDVPCPQFCSYRRDFHDTQNLNLA